MAQALQQVSKHWRRFGWPMLSCAKALKKGSVPSRKNSCNDVLWLADGALVRTPICTFTLLPSALTHVCASSFKTSTGCNPAGCLIAFLYLQAVLPCMVTIIHASKACVQTGPWRQDW